MSLLNFTISSIKMFYRDGRALFFTLFLPILFMTVFGIADFESFANVKIGVIDQEKTETSQQLLENLDKISVVDIKENNKEELLESLKKGEVDLVLELPKNLVKKEKQQLLLYVNQGRIQQANQAVIILKEVFNQLTYKIYGVEELYSFRQESESNKNLSYVDYLIPGIIALSIMQMSLMQIIFTIVGYREKNIFKRLQTTPIKSMDFILSQVITRLIISILQVLVLAIVAIVFFNIKIEGSYILITLLTILGSIIFITMGIALSGIAKTQNTAGPLANIIMMPMMFLGDVFFPATTMPVWLQEVVKYLPLNYLSHSLREVMINNASASVIVTDIYGLFAWVVGMILLASLAFRWKSVD